MKLKIYIPLLLLIQLTSVTVHSQNPVKRVVVEEFTGTWCASCGYGGVYFEHVEENYPNAIPVAIHNGYTVDPMEILDVELYMLDYFAGSPTFLFDRTDFPENSSDKPSVSASNTWEYGLDTLDYYMEKTYNDSPLATLGITQSYNADTRVITATITSNFLEDASGNFRLNCFIVEDSVTGGSAYNQSNHNFSGWTDGPSYLQSLIDQPQIIPGYVHNHVLRAMLGNPEGATASIPSDVMAGDSFSKVFTYTLPEDQDENQISIIGIIQRFGPSKVNDRQIVNANSQHLLLEGEPTSLNNINNSFVDISVYPNPVKENATIEFYVKENGPISCSLYNMHGQKLKDVFSNDFVQGEYRISLGEDLGLNSGYYCLVFTNGKYTSVKKIIVSK